MDGFGYYMDQIGKDELVNWIYILFTCIMRNGKECRFSVRQKNIKRIKGNRIARKSVLQNFDSE